MRMLQQNQKHKITPILQPSPIKNYTAASCMRVYLGSSRVTSLQRSCVNCCRDCCALQKKLKYCIFCRTHFDKPEHQQPEHKAIIGAIIGAMLHWPLCHCNFHSNSCFSTIQPAQWLLHWSSRQFTQWIKSDCQTVTNPYSSFVQPVSPSQITRYHKYNMHSYLCRILRPNFEGKIKVHTYNMQQYFQSLHSLCAVISHHDWWSWHNNNNRDYPGEIVPEETWWSWLQPFISRWCRLPVPCQTVISHGHLWDGHQ